MRAFNTATYDSSRTAGDLLHAHRRGGRLTAIRIDGSWSYGGVRFVEILACYGEAPSKRVKVLSTDVRATLAEISVAVGQYYEITDRSDRQHDYRGTANWAQY